MTNDYAKQIRSAPSLSAAYDAIERYLAAGSVAIGANVRTEVATEAVRAFNQFQPRIPIADQLGRFGPEIIKPLEDFVASSPLGEAKILACLVLLQRGSQVGVPFLLNEMSDNGDFALLAAIGLTNAGIRVHAPILFDMIRRHPVGAPTEFPTPSQDALMTLLRLVPLVHTTLPQDIQDKLLAEHVPSYIRAEVVRTRHTEAP